MCCCFCSTAPKETKCPWAEFWWCCCWTSSSTRCGGFWSTGLISISKCCGGFCSTCLISSSTWWFCEECCCCCCLISTSKCWGGFCSTGLTPKETKCPWGVVRSREWCRVLSYGESVPPFKPQLAISVLQLTLWLPLASG